MKRLILAFFYFIVKLMPEENIQNTESANNGSAMLQPFANTVKIKYNQYGMIYNSNIVKNNFLVDAQLNQILANQQTLTVFDLVLLNNYYGNLTFIFGLLFLVIGKLTLLKKKNFVKEKLEFEYYLVDLLVTSLIIFGFFLNNWKMAIILALAAGWSIVWIQRKNLLWFIEQVFYRKKVNINLDTSLEEEFELLTVSKIKDSDLPTMELDTYARSSDAIISTLNKKFFNLFSIKILEPIIVILTVMLIICLLYICYFVLTAYNVGLLEWFIK